ncbi:MAG: GNAT family N-acetyltransferase [Alphaproteobacteria bacterium]|nr:GNAT family N-acetyltransferase [Alphaproteobacteria bacterium]
MDVRQIIPGSADYAAMCDLRERVLRKPLGLVLTAEEKALDAGCHLLGCFDGAAIQGCMILQKHPDGGVQLRQVAVDDAAQGRGVGGTMLAVACEVLRGWGVKGMYCHARETARGFYLRHGWQPVGAPFEEHTVPHILMEFTLPAEKTA